MLAILAVVVMVSPMPFLAPIGDAVAEPMPVEEYTVASLTDEDREAFVAHYMDVFVHKTSDFEQTPGTYPDYEPALRMSLVEDIIQRMKDDPQYAPKLAPVNAGPALGMSSPEDPLVDQDGNPVTQERVDDIYANFLYGLIFDREKFFDHIQQVASKTMAPENATEPEPSPDNGYSEQDNAIRQAIAAQPMDQWDNLNTQAIMPEEFVPYAAVPLEEVGVPAAGVDVPQVPAPVEIPPIEMPEIAIPQVPTELDLPVPVFATSSNVDVALPPGPIDVVGLAAPDAPVAPAAPALPENPPAPAVPDVVAPVPDVPAPDVAEVMPDLPLEVERPGDALRPQITVEPPAVQPAPLPAAPEPPTARQVVMPAAEAVAGPEMPNAHGVISAVSIDPLDAPATAPAPSNLPGAVDQSPLSVVPAAEWLNPATALDLPSLLDFLSDLTNLADDTLYELLGLLGESLQFPDEIRGPLSEFEHVAGPIAEMDQQIVLFDSFIDRLLAPPSIADAVPLPAEVGSLVDELTAAGAQLQFAGTVNGQRFNGTWLAPIPIDVNGDSVPDLVVQMSLQPGVDGTIISDVAGGAAPVQPRLLVQRVNGFVDAASGLDVVAGLLEELAAIPDSVGELPPEVPITQQQLIIAGVATQKLMDTFEEAREPVPDAAAFAYHLTIAFRMPGAGDLVVHDVTIEGGADVLDVLVKDVGPTVEVATAGATGAFAMATAVLHDETVEGDVASVTIQGQPPLHIEVAGQVAVGAGTSSLEVRPAAPYNLQVSAQRMNPTAGLALTASSVSLPTLTATTRGDAVELTTTAGAALALAHQLYGADRSSFDHHGLLIENAPARLTATLTEGAIELSTSARGSTVTAVAGLVQDGGYGHATWTSVEGAGRWFNVAAGQGLEFSNDIAPREVRAVVARTGAAMNAGAPVSGFQLSDELMAFALPGVRTASVLPGEDGGFMISTSSSVSRPFVLDYEHQTPHGLEYERFSFSSVPTALSIEISPESINIGGSEEVGQVVGDMERPLDGSDAPPTHTALVLSKLNGTASVAMSEANVNLMANGGLADGAVLASNIVDDAGEHEFMAIDGNHMLADVEGTARQHSAQVSGMTSLGDGVGGIISGLAGGTGGIDLNMGMKGPLCWSFGKEANVLRFCISNVPDHIGVDFALVPHPHITYEASEVIHNISLQLIAPAVDILLYIAEIPELITLEFTRDGADLIMSDHLGALGMVAKLRDTTIAAGIEDIPETVSMVWGETGMGFTFPEGDAIGRIYASISRPGLSFFTEILHLPSVFVSWGSNHMSVDLGGDRIGSAILQLILNPADAPSAALQLLFEAHGIPGLGATWLGDAGTFTTDGVLDLLKLQLIQGIADDPNLSLLFQIEDVPRIERAAWTAETFDLDLGNDRIGRVFFQFLAGDLTLYLEALGVPGLHLAWGTVGGSMSTDGPLDRIEAFFRKGIKAPMIQVILRITDVPQLRQATWGAGISFEFEDGGRIGQIFFEFLSDQVDDANDILFQLNATGLPGFSLNPDTRTFATDDRIEFIGLFLRLGPEAAPPLLMSFEIEGVPKIAGLSWADGFDLNFDPITDRIERIEFLFLSDAPGTASDLYVHLLALGVPGLLMDTANGVLASDAVLDELTIDFRVGAIMAPTILMTFTLEGVPAMRAGAFGEQGFGLHFTPADAQIERIAFLFQVEQAAAVPQQLQIYLEANGFPGIALGLVGGGTLETDAALDRLIAHFHTGDLGAPLVELNFLVEDMPRITGGNWGEDQFELGLDGRIGEILLEFNLDLPDAPDVYLFLNALGVPGFSVAWPDGNGAISTNGVLDELTLLGIIGARSGFDLVGEGIYARFTVTDVPRIISGTWGDDNLMLDMDGRIGQILVEFNLDLPGGASDLYMLLDSRGIPGIEARWPAGAGTISTAGQLDELTLIAVAGPRNGYKLAGEGISVRFSLLGVPAITGGEFRDDSFALPMAGRIEEIILELVVDQTGVASDVYLLFNSKGVPGIDVRWPNGVGTVSTHGTLDLLTLVAVVGPRAGTQLTGEGLSVLFTAEGVPAITGGEFRDDSFALPMAGRINKITLLLNMDLAGTASDVYLFFGANGVPGIDVRWPDGQGTISTTGTLDVIQLIGIVGPRVDQTLTGDGISIKFLASGIPAITGGQFRDDSFSLPLDGRIEHIALELILDLAGQASDVYLLASADGVPGIDVRWPDGVGTISTSGPLDLLTLVGIVGPREGTRLVGEGISITFLTRGVPAITGGEFRSDALTLGLDGRIEQITAELIVDLPETASDVYLLFNSEGVPGVAAAWPDGVGTITTDGRLDLLELLAILGPRSGLALSGDGLSVRFSASGIPAITGGEFGNEVFALPMVGQIEQILVEFILNQADDAGDAYLLLRAEGIPGIDVRWPGGEGTFATTDTLDLLTLVAILGPRNGINLAGNGISAKFILQGVPAISDGRFGGDIFSLGLDGQIERIAVEFILNQADDALDAYLLFNSEGVPGITVTWPDGQGTVSTHGTLDLLSLVAILGPRNGLNLAGEGFSAKFIAKSIPAITGGEFGGNVFALPMVDRIEEISLEFILDLAGNANDAYVVLNALGIPGLDVRWPEGIGTISTTGTLDELSMAAVLGPRSGTTLTGNGFSAKFVVRSVPAITGGEFGGDVFALPMVDRIEEIIVEFILNQANDAGDAYALFNAKGVPGIDVRWPAGQGTLSTTGVLDEMSLVAILGPRSGTTLVGEGMSATFIARGIPAITGGQFGDEIFAAPMVGQIEQITLQIIFDQAGVDSDVFALFDARGVPGIDVRWPGGEATMSTTDTLDLLNLVLLVGERRDLDLIGEGLSVKFVIEGVPAITGGQFGGDIFKLGLNGQIRRISLELILDLVGVANDGYVLLNALGIPGIDVRWPGGVGTISTTGQLDELSLAAILGPRSGTDLVGEGFSAKFLVKAVPAITGGEFGGEVFALPMTDRIEEIAVEVIIDAAVDAADAYALFNSKGVPGIDVRWPSGQGTLSTSGQLDELSLVAILGPRSGTTLVGEGMSATFVARAIPAITGGSFSDTSFTLGMAGRIEQITLQFIYDQAGTAMDVFALFDSRGVPGIDLSWAGGGSITTTGPLDLLSLVAIVGPRSGTTLTGEGLSIHFSVTDLPRVRAGSFGKDSLDLDLDGRIGEILLQFILDQSGVANDAFILFNSKGVPGITVSWPGGVGSISTAGTLDLLDLLAIVGPRDGLALNGEGLSARFTAVGVPAIRTGSFGGDAFALDLAGQITSITLEFILNLQGTANDAYILFNSEGVPGISVSWPGGVGSLSTTDTLDLLSLVAIVGPRNGLDLVGNGLSAKFVAQGIPAISGGSFGADAFNLGLNGRITSIALEFILNMADDAKDAYILFNSEGVPGISVSWPGGVGSLSTTGRLDLLSLVAIVGPRNGLDLVGEGLSAKFVARGIPTITGGAFGGDVFRLDLAGQIEQISFEFILDLVNEASDVYALFNSEGVPGIAVSWPAGQTTLSTSDELDLMDLVLIVGPRQGLALAGEGIFARLTIEGVPVIRSGGFGASAFTLDLAGRVTRVALNFIMDQSGTANDIYALFEALGVPGISLGFTASGGTIGTQGTLDSLNLVAILGPRSGHTLVGQGMSTILAITGVPAITGSWTKDRIDLGLAGRITEIVLEFILDLSGTASDVYALFNSKGVPGITVGLGASGGSLGTTGTLDLLDLLAIIGKRTGTELTGDGMYARFTAKGVPAISASGWSSSGLSLGLAGRIDEILLEFILNVPGTASDIYALFNSKGVPGISLAWGGSSGSISTTDALDLLSLVAILGPRSGTNLAGQGMSLHFGLTGVPAITGSWNKDTLSLGLAGRIQDITLQFVMDLAGTATDVFLLFNSKGVPGINVNWGTAGGALSTTGVLDELGLVAIVGPRNGQNLAGTGLSVKLVALGVPRIVSAPWGGTGFNMDLGTAKIASITFEVFVNMARDADDLYLLLAANGIPTVNVGTTSTGFSFDTPRGLDSATLVFRKGTFAYNPDGYGGAFVGAWLRPDGYGTSWPGVLQFGLSAKISGFKGASWASNAATKGQDLTLKFVNDPTLRVVADLEIAPLVAKADLTLSNLPATGTLSITPDVTTFTGTRACTSSGCLAATPWLQGFIEAGTRNAMSKAAEPYWPWQTISDPAGKCTRNGSATDCGLMGNTYLDLVNPGLATKWKIYSPLPTSFSFTKSVANGVPSYGFDAGVAMGKVDMRINTKVPLPLAPYELNVMAVATVSNLPTALSVGQSMGTAAQGGKPTITATAAQPVERVFLGLRFDGGWYADPGSIRVVNSDVTSSGFPIWMTVEDIPTSVSLSAGKSTYGKADCSSCSPALPGVTYTASAPTLDATLYTNIGQLWNTIGRTAIKNGGSAVPDWLKGLAQYDSQGHLLLQLVDIPRDGISISTSGNSLIVDPSPQYGERLGRFFGDFQLKFHDGKSQPSKCVICLDFAELKYFWHYDWWFGIETLSLLLDDLGRVKINPSLESIIEIDGRLVFHFRAGAGFSAGAGLELYVVGSRVLCVCINLPTLSLILDPGFISFEVLNWECCTITYFYLGWPCSSGWKLYWCDRHYKMGVRGTYPGNWGFDLPIAVPPVVPFRGLDVAYGTHHVFINPRTLLCGGVDWKNPTAVCVQLGRLYPSEFIVAYGFVKYFSFRVDTWTDSHRH